MWAFFRDLFAWLTFVTGTNWSIAENTTKCIAVSHGSAYTVVRATQQVNVKRQYWGCQNSVTPELID